MTVPDWLVVRGFVLLCKGSMWIDVLGPYGKLFDVDMSWARKR